MGDLIDSVRLGDVSKFIEILSVTDPSVNDNEAIIEASRCGNKDMVNILLSYPSVDPSARKNLALIESVERGHEDVVRLLLKMDNVDPSAKENLPIIISSKHGYFSITKMLLERSDVDPSVDRNTPIINAVISGNYSVVSLLLKNRHVDPSDQNNLALRNAAQFGLVKIFKLLLKDPRVNPSVMNDEPLFLASSNGHMNIVKILLENINVNPSAMKNRAIISAHSNGYKNIVRLISLNLRFYPHDVSPEIIEERLTMDKNMELIYFHVKEEHRLNVVRMLFQNYNYEMMIYAVNCLTEKQLFDLIESDISDENISLIFRDLEKLRFPLTGDWVYRRNLEKIFKSVKDIDWIIRFMEIHENLQELKSKIISHCNIDRNILKLYQYFGKGPYSLTRPLGLSDVVGMRDINLLYEMILRGKYIGDPVKMKHIYEFTEEEVVFVETFYFSELSHKDYINNLSEELVEYLNWYIFSDDYYTFNLNLEKGIILREFSKHYDELNKIIIGSPKNSRLSVLYKVMKGKPPEFSPGESKLLRSFTSCSSIKDEAEKSKGISDHYLYIITCPIESIGLDISDAGRWRNEVLLPSMAILNFVKKLNEETFIMKYVGIYNVSMFDDDPVNLKDEPKMFLK